MRLTVAPAEEGIALGELLTGRGELPKPVFKAVLAAGGVMVNRHRATRADQRLQPRDEVVAHVLARGQRASGPQPLDPARILHLDEEIIAIDKPPGIPAQATETDVAAGLDASVRALLAARGERGQSLGLVHRLDLETSGVTIFGRTPAAVQSLTDQFREGTVKKTYIALVAGHPDWDDRLVDLPIGADRAHPGLYGVSSQGRPARTRFRRVALFGPAGSPLATARLEARPETGRTHQIRVHALSLGHPLLGDRRYGGPAALTSSNGVRLDLPRVALHAAEIRFAHPTRGDLTLSAPWPADLTRIEQMLQNGLSAT